MKGTQLWRVFYCRTRARNGWLGSRAASPQNSGMSGARRSFLAAGRTCPRVLRHFRNVTLGYVCWTLVWAPYQKPGHWNHACNIRIGLLGGWRGKALTPTHLTPDEQYTHISLWCLWGSPMIIGTPIERLDPFTLSLLSNDEVLEINQDPLGIQGRRIKAGGGKAVVKPLEDGSKAVGLLNPGGELARVSIDWSTLGLKGKRQVRDLWRQKDLGVHSERFTAEVRPHGVVLVRLTPAAVPDQAQPSRQ